MDYAIPCSNNNITRAKTQINTRVLNGGINRVHRRHCCYSDSKARCENMMHIAQRPDTEANRGVADAPLMGAHVKFRQKYLSRF
jgi:hypothetical protein